MITDILDYVATYADVRAVTGLNSQELPDATLSLVTFRNKLNMALSSIKGIYTPSTDEENLQTIFDRLADTDEFYWTIQQFAIYVVADAALDAVGLRAFKSFADGKGSMTRFSAEATFQETRINIKSNLTQLLSNITGFFDQTEEDMNYLLVVSPDIDLVLGE